jgi:hypothetical protein
MRQLSIGGILGIVALVLGVVAVLDVFRPITALGLAMICLAVAHLLPNLGRRVRL